MSQPPFPGAYPGPEGAPEGATPQDGQTFAMNPPGGAGTPIGAAPPSPQQYAPPQGVPPTAQPLPAQATPIGGAPASMNPAQKRMWITLSVIVGVLVALIAGASIAISAVNSKRTPESAVTDYLALIASGDGDRATALVDPGISTESRAYLTSDVLSSTKARIVVTDVYEVPMDEPIDGVDYLIRAEMTLDGEQMTHDFPVRSGPKEHGVFTTWKVTEPFLTSISVYNPSSSAPVTIGGAEVDFDNDHAELTVYPGVYELTSTGSKYVSIAPVEVAAGDIPGQVSLTPVVTDTYKDAALSAAVEFVKSCGSVSGNRADACPYPVRSTDLAVLETRTLPTSVSLQSATADENWTPDALFETDIAQIAIQSNPSFFDSQPSLQMVSFTVVGRATMNEDGSPAFELWVEDYDY